MLKLPFRIYSSKIYWAVIAKFSNFRFKIFRFKLSLKNFFSNEKYNLSSFFTHVKLSIWDVLKAFSFVAFLFIFEFYAKAFWHSNSHEFPIFLRKLLLTLPKPVYPGDKDAVIELVSVIASVTGVILALFYPILATIASTAYAKVHAGIRNLLLFEKETQAYLRRLTSLTSYSIAVLLFMSYHFFPSTIVLAFLSFYSFTTLFGILRIGLGVYNFFEPSTLSNIVFSKLMETTRNVTTEGEFWNESSFQSHYYRQAFEQIENLSVLIGLCTKDNDLKESSFKSVFRTSIYILQNYLEMKTRIPIDSHWFPDCYHHKSFFASEMTQRSNSIRTSTFIQPEIKRDLFWFEERMIDNLYKGLEAVFVDNHINVFGESILMTFPLFNSLGSNTDLETGRKILDKLLSIFLKNNWASKLDVDCINYEDWKHEIGSIQVYCYALLRLQAGIFETASKIDSKFVEREFQKINWGSKHTIYSIELIPDLHFRLSEFQNYIHNEISIEGSKITPDWFFLQNLTSKYLEIIAVKLESTIKLFNTNLLSLANHFDKMMNPLLASFTSQLGLEVIYKIRVRIEKVKESIKDLDKLEICKGEFSWTQPDFDSFEQLLSNYEKTCLSILSKHLVSLSLIKWNQQYPDIFSHSYAFVSNHLNASLGSGNLDDFKNCFPSFLTSAIEAFANLNKSFSHNAQPHRISYQTLLDVLEISGFGYIYSVIYNNPSYWLIVKKSWDNSFLPTKENFELIVKIYLYYKRALFGTGVNYGEHHQREQTFFGVVKRLNLNSQNIDNIYIKPFLNENHYSNYYSVAELFIEIYLFTFRNAKEATGLLNRELFQRWCRDFDDNLRNQDDY